MTRIRRYKMGYDSYYEARNIVKEILSKDLLGPLSENEVIADYPVVYYVTGKLYPQNCQYETERTSSEDAGDTDDEQGITVDNGVVPSSMGMSFSVSKSAKTITVSAKAAIYVPQEMIDEETKHELWKRNPVELHEKTIKIEELKKDRRLEITVDEGLCLVIYLHKTYADQSKTVTVSLINKYKQGLKENRNWVNRHTYFQPEVIVSGDKSSFTDIRRRVKLNRNKEFLEQEMLYSKYDNYVTGYGCAAKHHFEGNTLVLSTSYIPFYELNQMMPAVHNNARLLSMEYLSKTDKNTLVRELSSWALDYGKWIEELTSQSRTINEEYKEVAKDNIEKCRITFETIKKSIQSLNDENVYKAFKYANEAMLLQRMHTLKSKGEEYDTSEILWYPFQLAFILKEIASFSDPHSNERKRVDLLWFPTGGGKTEAYLGIAAFVIFLRRLRNPQNGSGVSVIMRYTLRLLTFQQFERAAAMICACELLRMKYHIPGQEISIGLWAGKALTPNTIEMAQKILDGYPDPDNESSNPRQLEKCPWCGTNLEKDNYYCSTSEKRMYIKCGNPDCDFHNGLPVRMIDEEIYHSCPSFLIATVDKFAQVALREQTFSLFGHSTNNLPPELIIQDELHLISGPLGTITGIYESAFQQMCTHKKIRPKVIASTATIKNAKEQINALYGEDFTQFPPQGLDADYSYFAVKSSANEKPSRMYAGCMGTGMSATTIMIRVMASTLFATRYLEALGYDEKIVDSFWTITSYFNTLRELGGAIVRVVDNVQDRFAYLKETKFKDRYPINGGQLRYDKYIELTSREKSENIGRIIQKDLLIKYSRAKKDMPYDFILSSNMISVGVDIARLNTMLVVGQPKTTSEYIQATSRVGRETPGFIFTIYNQMRSRDKSHFEQFYQYHEAFYKYVEATSVTPFAERARDRALQTLYIILCRFYIEKLENNESAGKYRRNIRGLEDIRKYILDHVSIVDPDEYENVEEELREIELEWEELAIENPDMTYRNDMYQKKPALFKNDYEEDSRFRVMNSMRSVETSVQVVARE